MSEVHIKNFKRVLVANRGEIAIRVFRALNELGITSVAVYSKEDKYAMFRTLADEAYALNPEKGPVDAYLDIPTIIKIAKDHNVDAIHPGYGFLAENASFAKLCKKYGIAFVGPSGELIDRMGDKAAAREPMMMCGVPTVPGSDGVVESVDDAREFAERVGYPVLIKASAGGGGKGMREVHAPEELADAFMAAKAEAKAAFANDDVYIEKLVLRPRHVEIQVLADDFGHQIALCERDCSIQRRHQKLLEEAPSPALDETLRRNMAVAAVKAVRAVDYRNAGTIEFLLDNDGKFYFMEMNTRVQVEHPVTEQITGVDIIKEQLRIASGEPMSCADEAPFVPNGHAIEFRINAEDPENGFRPCPGTITRFDVPGGPGVRVEAYVQAGSVISPFYDSMVAKLIVWGRDRDEALARGRRALSEFNIEGIATTIPFHQAVLENEIFQRGEAHTDFIEVTGL